MFLRVITFIEESKVSGKSKKVCERLNIKEFEERVIKGNRTTFYRSNSCLQIKTLLNDIRPSFLRPSFRNFNSSNNVSEITYDKPLQTKKAHIVVRLFDLINMAATYTPVNVQYHQWQGKHDSTLLPSVI